MKLLIGYSIVVASAVALVACGGKKENGAVENAETIDLTEYTPGHAVQMSDKIDSLALNADDLSPDDAVNVLLAYVEIERDESNANKAKVKRETMRKFADVYDIVMGNYGNEFRAAIDKARRTTELDLSAIAADYRERLSDYDEGAGIESAPAAQKEKADTTVSDSTKMADAAAQVANEGVSMD